MLVALSLLACTSQTVWFSHETDVTAALVGELDKATSTLDVAVYTFTSEDIRDALVTAQTQRGVAVRVVIDTWEANDPIAGQLAADGVNVRRLGGYEAEPTAPGDSKMHHKFAVVDGAAVLSGSFNYTRTADFANYENLMLVVDPGTALAFSATFEEMWERGVPQQEW